MPVVTTTTTTTTTSGGQTTTTTTTVTTTGAGAEEGEPPAAASDRCLMNSFGGTISTFPRMSGDFDKEWLSAALNAPVEGFELRYAGEGATALTFVLHSIRYGAGARDGLPSSVAIKIHAESAEQRQGAKDMQLYDKEIYFYTQLHESMPVRTPTPLAVWTHGPDGTDPENHPVEFFALMMSDMTQLDGTEHEVHDISGLDPPRMMTDDDLRALGKLQVRVHNRYWENPLINEPPLSTTRDAFSLDAFRTGLAALEEQWKTAKAGMAAKCKQYGAEGWGDGPEGW